MQNTRYARCQSLEQPPGAPCLRPQRGTLFCVGFGRKFWSMQFLFVLRARLIFFLVLCARLIFFRAVRAILFRAVRAFVQSHRIVWCWARRTRLISRSVLIEWF